MKAPFIGLAIVGCIYIAFGFWSDIAVLSCLGGILLGAVAVGWFAHRKTMELLQVVVALDFRLQQLNAQRVFDNLRHQKQAQRQSEQQEADSADWWKTGKDWYDNS